jgi:hypothetical protein
MSAALAANALDCAQDFGPFSRLSQATARELDDLKTGPEHAKKWRAFRRHRR